MQPILSQIIFKPFPSAEQTSGGIFVPQNAREISNKGTIVAVGKGTHKKPMKLKEGMVAYRVLNWGQEVMINNELHFIMDQGAILSIE